jgi:hypothetical protein
MDGPGKLRLLERAVTASTNSIVITDPNQPDDPIVYVKMSLRTYYSLATRTRNVPTRELRLTTRCRLAVRLGKQSSGTTRRPYPQPPT